MKRNVVHSLKFAKPLITWREAEYAALKVNAVDTFDDRVSENIFDIEDEHAEIGIIVDRMIRSAH
jgi:hypothetical protein